MDFFAQQDVARRNTRLLVLLFIAAVLLLIVLTNAAIAGFLYFGQDYNVYSGHRGGAAGFWSFFSWQRFGGIGLAVTATVALVVLVRWMQLSSGGKAVAEGMGGTRILPQTRDRAEKVCLNIVDEMALAASMPAPAVYVLNDERGINAFAAGITPADAVVAVTRGTIEQLRRHELQGVIAHEFSHILNGDMRLNIRLAAMLKGITFIGDVGHLLLHSHSIRRTRSGRGGGNSAALPLFGLVLYLLGLLGEVAAGFIKAGISRQKEYLADASAVQFTRSTEGIGSALKVIGGYIPGTLVHAGRAAEMSHIFFGQITHPLWQLFPTHPPLRERIKRIDPRWDGQYIARKPRVYAAEPSRPGHGEVGVGRATLVAAAAAMAATRQQAATPDTAADADFTPLPEELERETAEREEIPVAFVHHSHEPLGAQALVLSLLMSPKDAVAQRQLAIVGESGTRGLEELVNTLHPGVRELGAPQRLPLLELCLPALKSMSARQYRAFKNTLLQLIQADRQTELHEWCLFQLLRHYLDPEFVRTRPSRARYGHLQKVAYHVRVVLSVLAHESAGPTAEAFRCGAKALGFDDMTPMTREQASVAAFGRAVQELADCYPLLKPRLLKAMTLTATRDDVLAPIEREIITSIAAVMDCPVPTRILQ